MPSLSPEDRTKFDAYIALINDSIESTQTFLATKDPAERVPLELRLSNVMEEVAEFAPDLAGQQEIREHASGNSIYMHEFAGKSERWDQAQVRIDAISNEYGLDATAVAARLETGVPNLYVEQMWIRDDLQRLATATDLNLDDPSERLEAVNDLSSAYQYLREDLVASHVLYPVPPLEEDYFDAAGRPQLTQAERDNFADHFDRTDWSYAISEGEHERFEAGVAGMDALVERFTNFAARTSAHAAFASELWDQQNMLETPVGYLREDERERELEMLTFPDQQPFKTWEDRSSDDYSLTKTAADHHEIMRLLKENTTDAQYNRFRTGDLSAIEHITRDPVFSRQLLVEVEASNRATGFDLTREQEDRMTAARDHLKGVFETERDNDHENER